MNASSKLRSVTAVEKLPYHRIAAIFGSRTRGNRHRTRYAAFDTLLDIGARTTPALYRVAVFCDSDDTHTAGISYFAYVRLERR